MNIVQKVSVSAVVSIATLLTLGIIPANAITGSSNDQSASGSSSNKTQQTPEQIEAKRQALEAKSNELEAKRNEAEAKANALRQKQNSISANQEYRKKKCESRKQGLNTKIVRISTNAQRVQDRITRHFDKAKAYQLAKVPTAPAGYDDLVVAASSAQSVSAASITTLKSVTPSVDCNKTTVSADVIAFRVAAQDTRTKLKAYRAAVRAVLVSLDIPKSTNSSNTTTTGGAN